MVHDRLLDDVPARTLYAILRLRSDVFVVEQACVFLEPDGRDLEPGCRQLWIDGDGGEVVATARVLAEPDGGADRIGRIVTAADHRSAGLAAQLIEHFLATTDGPWVLDGQAHLAGYYRRFGFEVSGDEYLDDGIPHVPMRREAPPPT